MNFNFNNHQNKTMNRNRSLSMLVIGIFAILTPMLAQGDPIELFHGVATSKISTSLGTLNVYDIPGNKSTIIFWPSVLSDASIYSEQVNALRGRYRLVLIQPFGFGSSAPDRVFSIAECAQAMLEVMNALGIDRATLVGTSWGGLVAADVAAKHAERVEGLVLFSTPFSMPKGSPGMKERFMVWGARIMGKSGVFIDGVADAFFAEQTRKENSKSIQMWRNEFETFDKSGMATTLRSVMIERESAEALLPLIKARTVVVAGSEDHSVPDTIYRDGAHMISGAKFVMLSGASHIVSIDAPQKALEIIEGMMAENASTSGK